MKTIIKVYKGFFVGTLASFSGILLTNGINIAYNKKYKYYMPAIYGGIVGFYFGYFWKPFITIINY